MSDANHWDDFFAAHPKASYEVSTNLTKEQVAKFFAHVSDDEVDDITAKLDAQTLVNANGRTQLLNTIAIVAAVAKRILIA